MSTHIRLLEFFVPCRILEAYAQRVAWVIGRNQANNEQVIAARLLEFGDAVVADSEEGLGSVYRSVLCIGRRITFAFAQ